MLLKPSSNNRKSVFMTQNPWKSVDIEAVFPQAIQVQLIIIGYLFKLHSQVYIVFIWNMLQKITDLSWTHFIKMSSLFVKHQMKQRNKTGKVEGRGEALVILFCPFSTPSCFLCWLFTYTFCSCILFLFPSPQFAHLTGKNAAGSKGRACSGRAIHTSLP